MTNTRTMILLNLTQQMRSVGADIVRVSCPDKDSTTALKQIAVKSGPLVADIHFHYKRAEAADAGAACLRLIRNIGSTKRVAEVVRAARANGSSMRIGVNGGFRKHILKKYAEPCPEALLNQLLIMPVIFRNWISTNSRFQKASDVFLAMLPISSLQM